MVMLTTDLIKHVNVDPGDLYFMPNILKAV